MHMNAIQAKDANKDAYWGTAPSSVPPLTSLAGPESTSEPLFPDDFLQSVARSLDSIDPTSRRNGSSGEPDRCLGEPSPDNEFEAWFREFGSPVRDVSFASIMGGNVPTTDGSEFAGLPMNDPVWSELVRTFAELDETSSSGIIRGGGGSKGHPTS